MASLHQHGRLKVKEVVKLFPNYSQAFICRHCHSFNRGQPSKITKQDWHTIICSLKKLRETEGSFTSPRIAIQSGLARKVHNRTIRMVLNQKGYYFRRSFKKRLLKRADLHAKKAFCQTIKKRKLEQDFWNNHVATYLDAKGFIFKTRPLDQARVPSSSEWCKKNEGLKFGCTAKGNKVGSMNVNFMVGISWNKGVVLCEHYKNAITSQKMEQIIRGVMPEPLENSIDSNSKRIKIDGCPWQNSELVWKAFLEIGVMIFKIPPSSPDLNPIENFCILLWENWGSRYLTGKLNQRHRMNSGKESSQ